MNIVCCRIRTPHNLERIEIDARLVEEVLVNVSAAGVGFVDGLMVRGFADRTPLPYFPGSEYAGLMARMARCQRHGCWRPSYGHRQ